MKSEISALNSQVANLEKAKQEAASPGSGRRTNYNLHTGPSYFEVEIAKGKPDPTVGFREMQILAIEYQQHHVKINVCIKGEMFSLTALLDSGADVNIFSKKAVPSKHWVTATRKVVGLGKKTLEYEVPKAAVCFDSHCIKLKFAVGDIPIDFILGNGFLAAVEPHGSIRFPNKRAGYFITVPTADKKGKRIELPYISNPRVSTMVQAMQELQKAENRFTELKDHKSIIHIEEQLSSPGIQKQISELQKQFEDTCCSKEPNAFWHRKQHCVELPYK